ncbi:pleckstrin homology domain-containing family A member 6 isoform X5 [Hemiscyllium ocellatum]|nr:pleckstrin homology domain-containing family A member 6 isoform X5 [Hemiscyllium ocellatum]XP_060701322.1 pleckstrin homology domain-containing family A member 6 isoform X5 [Hemiscyllium ocellatum]XP_060701323.1 pleckstrin homology domain-containing family A member 6 isoform X5 [Hemiscyllium ocellatum]XP_060701324.1 pleckstrin homology domain-containing family A member 6 isoform X5 [Hemiscyllium ocellatum]XP_060701325.1 pleckstrin homology domain-containing family A member 6 isoform X5 [Hemi
MSNRAGSVRGEGGGGQRPTSIASEMSNHTLVSETSQEQAVRTSRSSKKNAAFGKRSNSMKRNPKANVLKSGWLFKQASSGVKSWNKRWFVLADRCLFYYRDEKEEAVLASIPLFSFRISPVQPSDNISRKHAFKLIVSRQPEVFHNNDRSINYQAEHAGIRTYYLSAENKTEMEDWINAMNEAASIQAVPLNSTGMKYEIKSTLELNHTSNHKQLIKPDSDRVQSEMDGFERCDRKSEQKDSSNEPTAKVNGVMVQEVPFDTNSPGPELRTQPGHERPVQPNGHNWQHASPGRPSEEYLQQDGMNTVHRRGFVPRTNTEKMAQRQSSLTQLQQWVNMRRSALPQDELRSSQVYHTPTRDVPEYYRLLSPYYQDEYPQFLQPGTRPDSICSVPAYDRMTARWSIDERQSAFLPRDWQDRRAYSGQGSPVWHGAQPAYTHEVDNITSTMRRMSLQPRSRSVPRSPSQGPLVVNRVYSPVRSPSARFDRLPARRDEVFGHPAYTLRRSRSAKQYDYSGDRRLSGLQPYHFTASRSMQDRMVPYQDRFQEPLEHYKVDEVEIDKLLGRLCEQSKNQREQEKWVLQLRKEKESLESALEKTHREMEMYPNQPGYTEQLVQKKESLQNQLINIRGELSQATTAFANTKMECDALKMELSIIHNDLWEQLNSPMGMQDEVGHKHIQKELWKIQDVMEGLRKSYPDRISTEPLKQHVTSAQMGTFNSNSPASPLSTTSLTSPLSPFSPISESQVSAQQTAKEKLGLEGSKKEGRSMLQTNSEGSKQDAEAEKHNKVGVVPPRTKSPPEEVSPSPSSLAVRSNDKVIYDSQAREKSKGSGYPNDTKSKMSVEEQAERMKRHQNGSLRGNTKRRSLTLTSGQLMAVGTSSPKPIARRVTVPRRKTTEIDICHLEAAVRGDHTANYQETPREEIARLRRMDVEPEHYSVDINKELSTPDKVFIPERYIEIEPELPLSPEELKEKQKKVERIKTLIAKSSLQNIIPLNEGLTDTNLDPELQLQEQEKRIEISCALATEASRRSRLLSVPASSAPGSSNPPSSPISSLPPQITDGSHLMCV